MIQPYHWAFNQTIQQLHQSAAFFIFQKENGNKKPVKRAQKNK